MTDEQQPFAERIAMTSAEPHTVKCPICGRPYKFMPFSAADQSACPKCVQEAEENTFGKRGNWK